MLRGSSVIYLAPIDWAFRMQHHHYIAREMAARGADVIFVENTGVRWPVLRDLSRVRKRLRDIIGGVARAAPPAERGITVVAPRALPIHGSRLLRAVNRASLLAQLREVRPHLEPGRTIVWIGLPNWTSHDVTRALRPRLVAYFNADEFQRVPGVHPEIRRSEPAIVRSADLVFVTSERLRALCEAMGARPIVVPVGVDVNAFAEAAAGRLPRPADLDAARGRLVGYVGGLNHKVDRALLESVASAIPDDTLVLIGPVEDPDAMPRAAANIIHLGERPHRDLPAYLQQFDVCLIPYVRTEFTDSVYPAKLNEYLAAGRPVVATAVRELDPFRSIVRVARDHAEFVDAVIDTLAQQDTPDRMRERVAAAARSSYSRIVPRMFAEVDRMLEASTEA